MLNKTFMNISTGQIKKVISHFGDISVLDGNIKVKSSELLDTTQWTDLSPTKSINVVNENFTQPVSTDETVNPEEFFSSVNKSSLGEMASQIENIVANNIPLEEPQNIIANNMPRLNVSNESAVIEVSIEEQKAELMRRYGAVESNTNSLEKQNDAFNKLLNPDINNTNDMPKENSNITRIEIDRDAELKNQTLINSGSIVPEKSDEEKLADMLFKNAKRNTEFKFSVNIDSTIPRLDFIEMMEDSYDVSIIEYFTNKIMNEFLEDTSSIKEQISNKIKEMISQGENKESKNPTTKGATKPKTQETEDKVTETKEENVLEENPTPKPKRTRRTTTATKKDSPSPETESKDEETKTTKTRVTRKKTPNKTDKEVES